MSGPDVTLPRRRQRRSAARVAVLVTAVACVLALIFRTALRSRYWAWRVEHAGDPVERGVYLGALCNAGDAARWGIAALLNHPEADVRQYGVLALHHVRTPWARARLLECVSDADASVRRLAAAGLAIQGDDGVIPTLKWLYQAGDEVSAATACLAFERLGSAEAVAGLNELALEPADAARRAALVEALAGIGTADCVPGLLSLLSDERAYAAREPREQLAPQALGALEAAGYRVAATSQATTSRAETIAERASAALASITGIQVPHSSEVERAAAKQGWAEWYARRSGGP